MAGGASVRLWIFFPFVLGFAFAEFRGARISVVVRRDADAFEIRNMFKTYSVRWTDVERSRRDQGITECPSWW
jgi:hypothetical protein